MLVEIKSKVSMPQGVKIFQGDNNVDQILISVDRFYGEYDLADFNAYLKIKYVDDSCNQIILNETERSDDKIVVKAKIDGNLTRFAGELTCQPFFANDDNSLCFNASTFVLEVEPSIEAYETIEQDLLPGTLVTLQAELKLAKQEYEQSVAKSDLGEFSYEEMHEVFDKQKASGICKCILINESGLKESAILVTFRSGEFEAIQTLIMINESGFFTKICTRRGFFNVLDVWEEWKEDYIATKEYVDSKLNELKNSIL